MPAVWLRHAIGGKRLRGHHLRWCPRVRLLWCPRHGLQRWLSREHVLHEVRPWLWCQGHLWLRWRWHHMEALICVPWSWWRTDHQGRCRPWCLHQDWDGVFPDEVLLHGWTVLFLLEVLFQLFHVSLEIVTHCFDCVTLW